MRHFPAIVLSVGLLGCGPSAGAGPSPTAQALEEERARRTAAEEAEDAYARRLRELEAQLSLARAEAQALRSDLEEDAPREVVRIGKGRSESPDSEPAGHGQDDWLYEPIPGDDGHRPVLRLYGTRPVAAAPRPDVPEGVPERLPLADVPDLPPESPISPPRARPTADPSVSAYQQALAHVRDGRFREALDELGAFVRAHPDHAYADNALYWRGEVFYAVRRYDRAFSAFSEVVRRFPSGNKVPEAILKMAMCKKHMGDLPEARALLEALRRRFPDTVAARVALREDPS